MEQELITIKVPADYKEKIKKMAAEQGMNVSEFIRYLLARYKEVNK